MDTNEIKELLPFYVAGTLEPDQKRMVEEALKNFDELREDLKFWQHAQTAVATQMAYTAAGHLSPKQVVDFAEGILVGNERLLAEKHLQSCARCSEEYRLVKASVTVQARGPAEVAHPTIAERFWEFVGRQRLIYAVPALAVAVVALIIINSQRKESATVVEDPTSEETKKIIRLPEETKRVIAPESVPSLILEYSEQVRGTERQAKMPVLRLDSAATNVELTLLIPHNTLRDVRYAVALMRNGKTKNALPETYISRKGNQFDSIVVTLPRELLGKSKGDRTLLVNEVLPELYSDLTPEAYRFSFSVEGKR